MTSRIMTNKSEDHGVLTPAQILHRIRGNHTIADDQMQLLASEIDKIVLTSPTLRSVSDGSFLNYIANPDKYLIKRCGFISPKILFLSDRIKSLCKLPYRRNTGEARACGGVVKNYLACSPYSPKENEMKAIMARGNVFCFLQADGLTDMHQQKIVNEILLEAEEYLHNGGIEVIMSFAAGPCRVCDRCAGEFGEECYSPQKKRFSLEACGIDVDWAMSMIAATTSDLSWKIAWVKDFSLNEGVRAPFKSVVGLLLLMP